MYNFTKSNKYSKIRENETNFVLTPSLTKNYQIISRLVNSERNVCTALIGPKGSGKHSLLASVLRGELFQEKKINTIHSKELLLAADKSIGTTEKLVLNEELLIKVLRSTSTIKTKEQLKIIEGEVVSISFDKIHLKTMDMDSIFDVGVRMGKEIQRERVCVGDVIKIYKESCFITRQGRASSHNGSFRSELLPIVPVPEGECIKNEIIETVMSIDEIDTINYKENGEEYLYSTQLISEQIQLEVDKKIYKWIKEGKATFLRGVIIIDDCEQLSEEIIQKIQNISNLEYSPNIFLIFNQSPIVTGNKTSNSIVNQCISLTFDFYTELQILEIIKKVTGLLNENELEELNKIAISKGVLYAMKLYNAVPLPFSQNSLKRIINLFEN
jgi:DNA helicase TIP49 (TBP-interacting protein)